MKTVRTTIFAGSIHLFACHALLNPPKMECTLTLPTQSEESGSPYSYTRTFTPPGTYLNVTGISTTTVVEGTPLNFLYIRILCLVTPAPPPVRIGPRTVSPLTAMISGRIGDESSDKSALIMVSLHFKEIIAAQIDVSFRENV